MGRPKKLATYSPEDSPEPPQSVPDGINNHELTNPEKQTVNENMQENHPYHEQLNKRRRDPLTGLLPGFNYTFDEFGRVEWEKLIPSQYFYPRKESFDAGTDLSAIDVTTLSPEQRVLNLEGIKFLMDIRGARNIFIEFVTSTPEHASVAIKIDWEPCIDQGMQPYSTIGICDAHAFNNVEPFKYVLVSLSENKGLSRATRMATRVKTYATDELRGGKDINKLDGDSTPATTSISPHNHLIEVINKSKLSFDKIKQTYIKEGSQENATKDQIAWKEKAEKWDSINDIEKIDIFEIIGRIKKKQEEKVK